MVPSSITMISGLFLKREVFILCILTSTPLLKIDKFQYIAKLSEAAVIVISESKLDDSVLSSEVQIENYDLIHSDRNRHGGGVACLIRNDLSYNTKSFLRFFSNIFIETSLPHLKPLVVGTVYHTPSHGSFTQTISENFSKINTNDAEIYILGDFNINLFSKKKLYIPSNKYSINVTWS